MPVSLFRYISARPKCVYLLLRGQPALGKLRARVRAGLLGLELVAELLVAFLLGAFLENPLVPAARPRGGGCGKVPLRWLRATFSAWFLTCWARWERLRGG